MILCLKLFPYDIVQVTMKCLYKVLVFYCAISYIEMKTIKMQSEENNGLDSVSNDWTQQKWNSILKNTKPDKCLDRLNDISDTKFSNEADNLYVTECSKNNINEIPNELESLLKDEVFPVEDINKKQIMDKIYESEGFLAVKLKDPDQILASNEKNDPGFSEKSEKEENVMSADLKPSKTRSEPSEANLKSDDSMLKNSEGPLSEKSSGKKFSFQRLLPKDFLTNSRSFIFNPNAEPLEQFQNCTTPKNESGICRYLQHCMIPNIVSSLNQFMGYVCIIKQRFIGVCCPSLPATVLVVKDQKDKNATKVKKAEECGISTNTRIVGGSKSDPKAWPWMAALLSKSKKNFFCGGAIINNRYVLTAAHCTFGVQNNEIVARLGEYDFRDDGKFHDDYAVVEIKRHGHYNRRTLQNDIALLKLEKIVVFNEFIKTICLPEVQKKYVGEMATLAGWGNIAGSTFGGGSTSDVLQEASFPVESNEKCAEIHGVPIPPSLICTSSKAGDKGACNGDSGGPLMLLDHNDRWKVIGLVSWGRRGCSPEYPTVYTRVSHFLEWINKHSK